MILKLVLRCVRKLSVGCIQTGYTELLPLQVCKRLWQGLRLGFQTCSLQLIYLLDLKYPSSSPFKPYFVGFLFVCIIFIGSEFIDPETFPWVFKKIFSGPYPNCTYGFSSTKGLRKVVTRVTVF